MRTFVPLACMAGSDGHGPAPEGVVIQFWPGKEVNRMEKSLRIEEFHALLTSEEHDSPQLTALRKLRSIEKPEVITSLADASLVDWAGWAAE